MHQSQNITIKGMDDKLFIQFCGSDWTICKTEFMTYLEENRSFLRGANVILDFGDHALRSSEMFYLRDALLDREINISYVISGNADTVQSSKLMGLKIHTEYENQNEIAYEKEVVPQYDQALILKRTIRSGTEIKADGDLVVLGDVNPGASIIAKGSVIVWGKLKGEVVAGENGNMQSVVCALELEPTQLTICGVRNIQSVKRSRNATAESAFLVSNAIKIQPWKS